MDGFLFAAGQPFAELDQADTMKASKTNPAKSEPRPMPPNGCALAGTISIPMPKSRRNESQNTRKSLTNGFMRKPPSITAALSAAVNLP